MYVHSNLYGPDVRTPVSDYNLVGWPSANVRGCWPRAKEE